MGRVTAPRLEGTVQVGPKRRLGFAEFGPHDGRPVFWLHGTPGARRQIPEEARVLAHDLGVRIIGVDRPGIGSSTPHLYPNVLGFATDLDAARTRGHHRTGLPQNAGRPIGDGRQHLKRRCVVILSPFEGQAQQQLDTAGTRFGLGKRQGFFIALDRMMVRAFARYLSQSFPSEFFTRSSNIFWSALWSL